MQEDVALSTTGYANVTAAMSRSFIAPVSEMAVQGLAAACGF